MPVCTFCKNAYEFPKGTTVVQKDSSVRYFCASKCRKNMEMGRLNKKVKWVRKSDIVARVESDEFLIILHNIINENNAIMIADKIINNFKNVKVIVNEATNQTLMKTVCTGISMYPDDVDRIEEIFRSSDIALYEAKNKGRSQFFKFKKDAETLELF